MASIATDDLSSSLKTCNIRRGRHDHRRLGTRADSVFRPEEIEGTKLNSSLFLSISGVFFLLQSDIHISKNGGYAGT